VNPIRVIVVVVPLHRNHKYRKKRRRNKKRRKNKTRSRRRPYFDRRSTNKTWISTRVW
jgi:hypothetical protein